MDLRRGGLWWWEPGLGTAGTNSENWPDAPFCMFSQTLSPHKPKLLYILLHIQRPKLGDLWCQLTKVDEALQFSSCLNILPLTNVDVASRVRCPNPPKPVNPNSNPPPHMPNPPKTEIMAVLGIDADMMVGLGANFCKTWAGSWNFWCFSGCGMARPWHGHGTVMARSWHGHGTVMARSWHGHGTVMARSWHGQGTAMPAGPCQDRAMTVPWPCHGRAMAVPWPWGVPCHTRKKHQQIPASQKFAPPVCTARPGNGV